MKIDSIKISHYNYTNFQGRKIDNLVEKLSMRDFYANPDPCEFIELRKVYNNLWSKLALPNNLKPRIQYRAMLSEMGFEPESYTIYVKKSLSPFQMSVRNKSGRNESTLRHEIEHVKQVWDIIRLLGAEKAAEMFAKSTSSIGFKPSPSMLKKMKEIEKTLGRISPNSDEGKNAQLYIKAIENYPDTEAYYGILSIKDIKDFFKYKNNILEKKANIAAKEYEPSILKELKVMLKEFKSLLIS